MDRRTALKQAALITGYAISASALTAVWQGCQRDPQKQMASWAPSFFKGDQAKAISMICDTVLPATDTPGAVDVGVDQFVDQFVHTCLTEEEQTDMQERLGKLLADCQTEYGKPFIDCSPEQRLAFLNKTDEQARTLTAVNPGLEKEDYPTFLKLKGLILMGYFTSEKVGTEVTAFLPIPGKYEPCSPYEKGQPAWTI